MGNKKKFIIIGFIGFSAFFLLFLFNFVVLQNYQPNPNQTNENRKEKLYMVENITVLIDYSGIKDNEIYSQRKTDCISRWIRYQSEFLKKLTALDQTKNC